MLGILGDPHDLFAALDFHVADDPSVGTACNLQFCPKWFGFLVDVGKMRKVSFGGRY